MATVHTEYGPGRIIDRETVRGRTRYKVAGDGFEVWVDQTKVAAIVPDNLRGQNFDLEDDTYGIYGEPDYYPGEEISDDDLRRRLRERADVEGYGPYSGDDDPARYSSRRTALGPDDIINGEDDSYFQPDMHHLRHKLRFDEDGYEDDDPARYSSRTAAGGPDHYIEDDPYGDKDFVDVHRLRHKLRVDDEMADDDPARYSRRMSAGWEEDRFHDIMNDDPYSEYGDEDAVAELAREYGLGGHGNFDDDPDSRYARRVVPGKDGRLAWAPLDSENSTTLPYDPSPQHRAIGTPGDDDSSTIQPVHNIDADERLNPSDSITFESKGDEGGPLPDADLFAKQGALDKEALFGLYLFEQNRDRLRKALHLTLGKQRGEVAFRGLEGHAIGSNYQNMAQGVDNQASQAANWASPGGPNGGYGNMIKPASTRLSGPEMALIGPILRTVVPGAVSGLLGGGDDEDGGDEFGGGADFGPGEGYGGMIQANYRPSGLSDKYIDLTASFDPTDPVQQFRHDPDAYINRVGHLAEEGLNPRFAEYMDLVEADGGIRTAAWKDVRKKAMRLKREGHVTVKDIAPNRIMASVVGDHGTYDVVIVKAGSFGGLNEGMPGHSIANWHCGCEWGKWAFRRKYTYVGRLCSHAYASYLTMQSAHMKGKPRQQKLPRTKKPTRNMFFPSTNMRHADALQNGPQRLVPELAVNDADDAHIFVDVTKDERDDTGPDDVVSDRDIVHFARIMRECEVTEQPYPRQLVAFLSRYAREADDTKADWVADDSGDADAALSRLRGLADSDQSDDFGDMADRVHRIQDVVEQARENGADASQFVASLRRVADGGKSFNDYLEQVTDGQIKDNKKPFVSPFTPEGYDPRLLPGVAGSPNTPGPKDPTGGLLSGPVTGEWPSSTTVNGAPPRAQGPGLNGDGPKAPGQQGPGLNGDMPGSGQSGFGGKGKMNDDGSYTVGEGDTLSGIAGQYGIGDYHDIIKNNPGNIGSSGTNIEQNADLIHPGDVLKGVGKPKEAPAAPAPDAAPAAAPNGDANPPAAPPAAKETQTTAEKPATITNAASRRRANSGGGSQQNGSATDSNGQATQPGQPQQPTQGGSASTSPGAKPATNPATGKPSSSAGTGQEEPEDTTDAIQQQQATPGQQPVGLGLGTSGTGSPGMGMDMGGAMDLVNTGVNAAGGIASGIGGALPGLASGIGSALSGLGSIFASKQDFDDWVRYAYPTADGEGKLEPHDHPFAGSGWPGPLDIGTSEEYADKARKDMDDVTDLEQHDVESSMSKWQKQGSHDGGTDDDSDIVRAFQANLADTALGAGAGGGSGRFDDISGAAQGFLRTAGRNYSLAEQSELIREGDKGGARNLASLDLSGTHYEDMTTLGW